MNKNLTSTISAVMLFMFIALPGLGYAQNVIPQTPINKVLENKNGLQLTDSQIKKLTIINKTIINKMIQVRAQAQIRKDEIDKFTSNWYKMHGTAVSQNVKEYYKFLADLKNLELEAIMKSRAILTREQLRKFTQLVSIETMMMKLESEIACVY